MGYVEEISRDEKCDLQRQIDRLEELENDSRDLQRNLEEAIKGSRRHEGKNIKLKPWETELRNKRADFNSINTRVQGLLQTLDNIKEGVKVGDNLIRQVAKFMKRALP
ncbi:hypothetical protein HG530_014604 [Fusarium avenaceum]|nr:hypothetical protein HG530_014604 [Fusarium avenaceum]